MPNPNVRYIYFWKKISNFIMITVYSTIDVLKHQNGKNWYKYVCRKIFIKYMKKCYTSG